MERPSRQMPRWEQWVFALGDIFGGGGLALLNVGYFFFLTDIVGLMPALAGLVVGTGKVVDAAAKPIVGQLTDNTRTRWGRRKPWITIGSIGIIASLAVLWWPTTDIDAQWAKTAIAFAAVTCYTAVAAAVTVPYGSLSTEATTIPLERNRLNLLRLAFSTLSGASTTLAATWLIDSFQADVIDVTTLYAALVGGIGTLFALPMFLAGLLTRERAPIPTERTRFHWTPYAEAWRLPEFRSLLGLYLSQAFAMDAITTLLLAFTTYVVAVSSTSVLAIIIAINLTAFGVTSVLVKSVSKNVIYGRLLPVALIAFLVLTWWPDGAPMWGLYVATAVFAVGFAGAQLMSWVMFPDVVDAGELRWGDRRAGTLSGLMTLIRSLGAAVVLWSIGAVLQLAGYTGDAANQPDSAVLAIRVLLTITVVGCGATGWWLSRRYRLTLQRCREIEGQLQRTRAEAEAHGG